MNCKHVLLTLFTALLLSGGLAQDKDSDQDGLPDAAEVLLGTNPQNADTDGCPDGSQ